MARFLAITLVAGAHASGVFLWLAGRDSPWFVGYSAYYGVELFFTLSGFLIGRLLFAVAATDATPHGWLVFMARRWLRTLPLYLAWMLLIPVIWTAPDHYAAHLLRYATLTQNLAWPMPPDHWFPESWSLTVEEWFYLLFSATLLGAVAATRSGKVIWPVIGAFILVPTVVRSFIPSGGNFIDNIYHIALLRLDAIAYGVALAKLEHQDSRLFRHPLLAGGAGLVLLALILAQDVHGLGLPTTGVGLAHMQLVAGSLALCLLLAGLLRLPEPAHPLAWSISFVARISYGIYIMNVTILTKVIDTANHHGWGFRFMIPMSLALILLLPALSWHFFEAPLLRLRPRQRR